MADDPSKHAPPEKAGEPVKHEDVVVPPYLGADFHRPVKEIPKPLTARGGPLDAMKRRSPALAGRGTSEGEE